MTGKTAQSAGCLSHLTAELEAFGWKTIDSCPRNRRVLVWTGENVYCGEWVQNYLTGDEAFAVADLEDGLRALVYPTHWQDAPRTHEFVLDTLVCHDFGEPKGQCAICGGYCKGEVM